MTGKTSIRFFENIPVRAVWDDESARWWFCAMDIAEALTKSKNPRVYWATIKRRNPQLIAMKLWGRFSSLKMRLENRPQSFKGHPRCPCPRCRHICRRSVEYTLRKSLGHNITSPQKFFLTSSASICYTAFTPIRPGGSVG